MKKIIGIVAEYNPFHQGHLYHIQESRKIVGEDAGVVCVMSGDFVQRGEWAIQPKHLRAADACRQGADLVVELPLPWCLSSAGYFASGAVAVLKAFGITHLSFGSESGNLEELQNMAEVTATEDFQQKVACLLAENPHQSYPAARSAVLGNKNADLPNNLLAIEYLLALRHTEITPVAIKRIGLAHDERGDGAVLSATEVRSRIRSGAFQAAHIDDEKMDLACVSRLRMLEKEAFLTLPDCQDGLGQRLYQAVRESSSLEGIAFAAKTKHYTLSRIRRSLLCAALGISREEREGVPPYARVLAMNSRGRELIAAARKNPYLPVITRPKAVFQLDARAQRLFALGASAHDLYMLCYPERAGEACGEDYRLSPVFAE